MQISKRVYVNIIAFLIASFLLVFLGAKNLVLQQESGSTLFARFSDASGLLPRNDVTMRGIVVGSVQEVTLADDGNVKVRMSMEPGVEVPEETTAEIVRRSPIGELTLELTPGPGAPLGDGAVIALEDTRPPPDVSVTIETLADVLHEVPSDELDTLVTELAAAVRGRGEDLARLSEAGADLPERLLEVRDTLEALIEDGPKVTGVLADNSAVLADDITQTRILAEILSDKRFELVDLSRNGAAFLEVAGGLIADEKANLSCLVSDFADVNETIAEPVNLGYLAATLDKNHFFFGGVETLVQVGLDNATWFRVQLVPPSQPMGRSYQPHRDPPDVFPADACRSRFGRGVGPADQPERVELAPESEVHPGR